MSDETAQASNDPGAISGGFFAAAGSDVGADLDPSSLVARYRGLIDHLPAIVYIDGVGPDDPMIDVSPAIEPLLGIARDAWLGNVMSWEQIVHPDDL